MDREEIEHKIREIVAARTNSQKIFEISADDSLGTVGIDSLAFSWILADMENTFNFVMMGSDIMKLKTLTRAVDYVEQKMQT